MKITTEAIHFTADQKLLDYIDKKVGKLEQYFDKIIDAIVTLRLENSGQIKDKIVDIRLNVPGDTIYITEKSKTFETAVDSASAVMRRQLIKYKDGLKAF